MGGVYRNALSYGASKRGCAMKLQTGVGCKAERKCSK